ELTKNSTSEAANCGLFVLAATLSRIGGKNHQSFDAPPTSGMLNIASGVLVSRWIWVRPLELAGTTAAWLVTSMLVAMPPASAWTCTSAGGMTPSLRSLTQNSNQ